MYASTYSGSLYLPWSPSGETASFGFMLASRLRILAFLARSSLALLSLRAWEVHRKRIAT